MSTENFIDNIILGDNVKAKTDFNALIHDRTQAQVDGLKTQMAQGIFDEIQPVDEVEVEQQEVEAQPETQVEESVDIVRELQTASSIRNAEIHLNSGEVVPVDFKTAEVVMRYMLTLDEEQKQYFLEDIIENERGLLKGIEQAFYEVGEE